MRGSQLLRWGSAAMALLAVLACGQVAAPPGPTPQAVATQVATAVQAASTPAAAAASPLATAAVAAATRAAEVASPVATSAAGAASPLATAVASSPIEITGWQVGPSDANVTLRNNGQETVDLSGWQLRVGARGAALPTGTRLAPGGSLTLHLARGTSAGSDVYLGDEGAALLQEIQPGVPALLVDSRGNIVAQVMIPGR